MRKSTYKEITQNLLNMNFIITSLFLEYSHALNT